MSFKNLPPELLERISRYLSNNNLKSFRLASRQTRNATKRLANRRKFSARVKRTRSPASVLKRRVRPNRRTNMNALN